MQRLRGASLAAVGLLLAPSSAERIAICYGDEDWFFKLRACSESLQYHLLKKSIILTSLNYKDGLGWILSNSLR